MSRLFLLRWCGWFWLGASALFCLIALRYLSVVPDQSGLAANGFTSVMFVSQAVLLGAVPGLVLALVALLLPVPRLVVISAVSVSLVLLTVLLVDTFVYQQYRFHLDASVWNLIQGGAAEETFVFAPRSYVKVGLFIAVLLVILIGVARLAWKWTAACTGRRRGYVVAGVLGLVVLAHNGVYAWADAAGYVPITRQSRVLPLHKPLTAKRMFRHLGIEVTAVEHVDDDTASGLAYPKFPLRFEPKATKPNVLLMVVDSWRADSLNEKTCPNLWAFSGESQRFDNHHSAGNATRIGMFSLFYGIPGTYWHDILGERRGAILVDELMQQGYDVVVFRSAPLFSPEFDRTIFADLDGVRMISDGATPAARDADLTADFQAWLETRDKQRPFFALLFYDAPHAYDFPADWPLAFQPSLAVVDYVALDNDTDPAPFHNRYLNSVRYVDHLAGIALDSVRAHGLMDQTVVLVTGDHGQEFNDLKLNYWGHNSNFARFQTHVPMLVRWPGRAPRDFDHVTSHFDVVPTIMGDVLGCVNPPEDYSAGRDLYNPTDRGQITMAGYNEYAAVTPGERHVVVLRTGEVDVLDRDYRHTEMTDVDRRSLKNALHQRGWFRPGATGP